MSVSTELDYAMNGRPCTKCHVNPSRTSHSYCGPCKRVYDKVQWAKDPERHRLKSQVAYRRNRDKWNAIRKEKYHTNREHYAELAKAYRVRNKDKIKIRKAAEWRRFKGYKRKCTLKKLYGISVEQFDAMLAAQGGLCAICRTRPATDTDHSHVSGMVRGILCTRCNLGIGQFAEDPMILKNAIDYLCQH